MAGTPTTNYKIPTYADSDSPNLAGTYNEAMSAIDAQMKKNADSASSAATAASAAQTTANTANTTANTANTAAKNAQTTANTANTQATTNKNDITALKTRVSTLEGSNFAPASTDKTLTVDQLAKAKVTANGIVYYSAS